MKAIYNNGAIELIEKPSINIPLEVLVIFPDKPKRIKKIGGLFKNAKIDYKQLEADLKQLDRQTEAHIELEA